MKGRTDMLELTSASRSFATLGNAEESSGEGEARLRTIINNIPGVIFELRYGSARRRFSFVSDQILLIAGIRPQDMLEDAANFFNLIHPDDLAGLETAGELAKATRNRFRHEFRIVKADGEIRWILANSQQPWGVEGAGVWVGYLEDITARKRADRSLAEFRQRFMDFSELTEKRSVRNRLLKVRETDALCALAGGLAHDFNNLLTGIMGNISLARLSLDAEHAAHLALEKAGKGSLQAATLAQQLLTFARGGEPVKTVLRVQSLVNEAFSLFLSGSKVQGEMALPANLHAIHADQGQMQRAFNNLVINAAHAMPEGGTLTVAGENVLLEEVNTLALPPGPYLKLRFKDEGYGIPEPSLKQIFDPYFTTKPGGTGLGLPSTLAIVRGAGGGMLVYSEVGVGTTFTLLLPSTGGEIPR
jgi:PAS domain S-box-containing protein